MGKSKTGDERRRYPRAPMSLLVQFRFNTLEEFLSEYATNISLGGMYIKTDEPVEEGSLIYLQFYLKDGAKLIEGLGKVVRVVEPDAKKRDSPPSSGMGVEFVNFDEESMELIRQIVEHNLSR